jgi:hypothetical protein
MHFICAHQMLAYLFITSPVLGFAISFLAPLCHLAAELF